jgi:phosphoglycerate dehydrogenase-like enzyme
MRIVCIDGESQYKDIVARDVKAPLEKAGHVFDWFEESFADTEAAIARASGYDCLYVVGDQGPVPTGLMERNPDLKLVSFVGTGARRFVNMDEAAKAGVTVTNVSDYASQSVAEHAIALMFAVARRINEGASIIQAGGWDKNQGLKLSGRRIGVVGTGTIGRRVIAMAQGLGMEVVYWARSPREDISAQWVALDELFKTSDVVSLHLTHTAQTDGIINRALLESMKPTAIFINTARAEIVDNVALNEIINAGAIFGAGLDVFPTEPPVEGTLPHAGLNTALTPHIGFHTDEANDVFGYAGQNILAFVAGKPTNVVT